MIPHILPIRPLKDLPNKEGFMFTGVTHDHHFVPCELAYYPEGRRFIVRGLNPPDLLGWVRLCN